MKAKHDILTLKKLGYHRIDLSKLTVLVDKKVDDALFTWLVDSNDQQRKIQLEHTKKQIEEMKDGS